MKTKFFVYIFIIAITLFTAACTPAPENNCSIYIDDKSQSYDNLTVRVSCNETTTSFYTDNKSLSIYVYLTNNGAESIKIKVTNFKLLNESTNIEYTINCNNTDTIELQPGIEKGFYFSADTPTSYKKENYSFTFTAQNNYTFYLYERPDSLRQSHTITFKVNNNIVHTLEIKHGRKLPELYVWESSDYLSYCDKWYNEATSQQLSLSEAVTADAIYFGYKHQTIKTMSDSSGVFLTGFNYIHKDGIVVIPSQVTYISNFALYNDSQITEIYIPSSIKKIYAGNFTQLPNLKKIHFAGSKEAWDAIPTSSTVPSNVQMVYNSTFKAK